MRTHRLLALGAAAALSAFLAGCAASKKYQEAVDLFYNGRMRESAEAFDAYGQRAPGRDRVVYYLNASVARQLIRDYEGSNRLLDSAYDRIEERSAKSVSGELGRFAINESTVDFLGEPFEQARIHYLKSLNYLMLDDLESAVVEARRLDLFLRALSREREGSDGYAEDAYLRY